MGIYKNFFDIHQEASKKTSEALALLSGLKIQVAMEEVEVDNLEKMTGPLNNQEECVGLFSGIRGDLEGSSALIFPIKDALVLSDLFAKRISGTAQTLSKLDQSILEEVGNIVSSSYLNVLGDQFQVSFEEEPPVFHQSSFEVLCEKSCGSFLSSTNKPKMITIKLRLFIQSISVNGYLFITFTSEKTDLLFSFA